MRYYVYYIHVMILYDIMCTIYICNDIIRYYVYYIYVMISCDIMCTIYM